MREVKSERLVNEKGIASGIRIRLDKKRTAVPVSSARRRRCRAADGGRVGRGERFPFHKDDMSYRHTVKDISSRVQRRRPVHHGHVRLHGHDEKISRAELLFPAVPIYQYTLSKRRDRLHRPSHRGHEVTEEEFFTKGNPAERSFPLAITRRWRSFRNATIPRCGMCMLFIVRMATTLSPTIPRRSKPPRS